jgi:hypothetical protein
MKNEKWFYPIQRNLGDRLYSEYFDVTTQFQEITPNRVFELKICQNEDRSKVDVLLCCMTKTTGRFSIFKCIEK